ncbi:PREDICTED: cytochrome P450 71B3-like [Camelina sativa]|uniref:Cytochrome P450 71B3-like n=1 Tax=Camelina sativa TaxID=90675 RepID=A0ABM0TSU6_CAMSA|nr:PREDICTED: cytochrome P450 71B3-like [Camelina sativa]
MLIPLYCFWFILLPALFLLIFIKKIKYSKQNLPPSPPKLPIIGNLHQLRGLFHRCLHDLSTKHGPVIYLRLGFVQMVVISSSEGAEEALKTHDLECCNRPLTNASSKFSRDGKDIAFAPYGEVLSQTLFCLVGSVICRAAFGQSFYESKHINKDRIKDLMFEFQKVGSLSSTDLFPYGLGWFMDFVSGQQKRLRKVLFEVDTLMDHVIDDHLKKPEEKTNQDRPDIVDSILDTMHKQKQDESCKLTIDHLKGIIQESI